MPAANTSGATFTHESDNVEYEYPEEKFNFVLDVLADEFCELDQEGNMKIKQEYQDKYQDDASFFLKDNSDESKFKEGKWSEQEHNLFLEALLKYGKNWQMITQHVRTRDTNHIRSHAQKFFRKLKNYLEKGIVDDQIADAHLYFEIL